MARIDSRIKLKRTTTSGSIPSVGPSFDHRDGTWVADNIYPAELFTNLPDETLWIGTTSGVREISLVPSGSNSTQPYVLVSGSNSSIIPTFGTQNNTSDYSNIGGGTGQTITTSSYSNVGGGQNNIITNSNHSILGGGKSNSLDYGYHSAIGGGQYNSIYFADSSTIAGGIGNVIGLPNIGVVIPTDNYANNVIAGGAGNSISNGKDSSIGGGIQNLVLADNVHILGSNITGSTTNTTYVNSLHIDGRTSLEVETVLPGGSTNLDLSLGNIFSMSLTGSTTLSYTNPLEGTYQLIVNGQTTGSALTYQTSSFLASGGTSPSLTATSSAVDIITMTYDGTDMFIVQASNFGTI